MVPVHDRPLEADARQVAGHWEGDLVFGARPSAVATLVDRATRYTIVVALPEDYKADTVAAAVIERMSQLPAHLRRSLTWDRGREMASHATITAALSMPVFFCDPHHPWQRGTNENTNRLLRQYLHKQADLSVLTKTTWTSSPPSSTTGPAGFWAGPPRPRPSGRPRRISGRPPLLGPDQHHPCLGTTVSGLMR